ncbi:MULTISPECIES: phage minor capsid protein [unclassified Egicoccus]|uniref:phage minor capsid protein n=1 Tax=unclassified Egicoccus TaxID=2635606 RepID=UPI00359DADE1
MPISPHMAEDLAKGVADIMVRAEVTMLEQVARRVERGIDQPGWAESKLTEIQQLRAEVEAEVARALGEAREATEEAVRHAYNRGVATAGSDLEAIGVSRELAYGRVDMAKVRALVAETVGLVEQTRTRILRAVPDVYRDVIANASGDVLAGTVTRRQAAQRTLSDFARRGVTGFQDRAGRSWDLPSYTEMAVRTGTGRAVVQGHVDRLVELGQDLVIVSDAPQECVLCRPWEGRVLSLTGQTRGAVRAENLRGDGTVSVTVNGTLDEARGEGLQHPNCRHTIALYQPGVTRPMSQRDTADPQGDQDRQELRRLERGVREWRRREAVAITDDERRLARDKVGEWEARRKAQVARVPASLSYSGGRARLGAR